MKKRATIIISGDVQDAGFRGKAMRIAQKIGLLGYIENLPNGTVRVICEGSEEAIKEFVEKIDIHDDDIEVENTSVDWSDATGEFEWFEVKFDNLGMEIFQGFATAGRKLSAIDNNLGNKIESMHTDMNTRFDTLDTKYGEIGVKMTSLENNIGDLTWQIKRLVDHVVGEEEKKDSQ